MNPCTIHPNYLATILYLVLLSLASAHDKRDEAIGDFVQDYDQVANFPKSSKRKGFWQDFQSFQRHLDLKLSKHQGSHYRQSKKFHQRPPEKMTFDHSEELLKLHHIKSAIQEEKLAKSVEKEQSWRSSSSSSFSSDDLSSPSSSSSFGSSSQDEVEQVVEEKITMTAGQEGIARM
mmetsp:Transcript_18241/g.45205  ORF Transcript_18241/g.45205 Transcript_18241/m.45205 type:complete len:176 (-) Transcript_18241:93-620(-)|eukprot:CAMPEP_0113643582 /NCGR_PEP_ID=MMETSP0017_2-20120614/22923_1 /TAXON_ID=2856 /ORGANISM="Cylindrotheca closterium" /LENGTH=175 /DNA_ID=CAMNT_0000555119 /DNA_START=14 /DNA_END=541 /DNA_ORIENTATION=- /assembly_acc=CAM_ASM_000147